MRFSVLLIFFSVVSFLSAKSYSQSELLTLNIKNSTVKEVLLNIEEQSKYYFMYSEKIVDVNRKVTINICNKKITDVLNKLFEGQKSPIRLRTALFY